jgi:hypothetical protein
MQSQARRPSQKDRRTRGGEGGIRTLGNVAATPDFESGTFDHSATSPERSGKIARSPKIVYGKLLNDF